MVTNDEEIRDAAYRKWQEAGEPEGDGVQFWLEAEKECCGAQESREDAIDESLEESFPASDSPARGSHSPGIGKQQQRRKR